MAIEASITFPHGVPHIEAEIVARPDRTYGGVVDLGQGRGWTYSKLSKHYPAETTIEGISYRGMLDRYVAGGAHRVSLAYCDPTQDHELILDINTYALDGGNPGLIALNAARNMQLGAMGQGNLAGTIWDHAILQIGPGGRVPVQPSGCFAEYMIYWTEGSLWVVRHGRVITAQQLLGLYAIA